MIIALHSPHPASPSFFLALCYFNQLFCFKPIWMLFLHMVLNTILGSLRSFLLDGPAWRAACTEIAARYTTAPRALSDCSASRHLKALVIVIQQTTGDLYIACFLEVTLPLPLCKTKLISPPYLVEQLKLIFRDGKYTGSTSTGDPKRAACTNSSSSAVCLRFLCFLALAILV